MLFVILLFSVSFVSFLFYFDVVCVFFFIRSFAIRSATLIIIAVVVVVVRELSFFSYSSSFRLFLSHLPVQGSVLSAHSHACGSYESTSSCSLYINIM